MKKHFKKFAESGVLTKVVIPVVLVLILAVIGYSTFKSPSAGSKSGKALNLTEAKAEAENFINEFLMAPGSQASITEISEQNNLYFLKVDIGTDVVESYLTKDGKLFFPQAFNIEEMRGEAGGPEGAAVQPVDLPKNDKPVVEAFVMSHCPFGTQIEKGLLPAVKALGGKIDFEIKFVDYAMHGEVEIQEQLVQYCIQKEQNDKFLAYMECFLVDGQTDSCLASTGIQKSGLDACVSATDKQFKITENFKNNVGFKGTYPGFDIHATENQLYGVAGSPTLVINGVQAPAQRDPASLLSVICSAFSNPPAECSTQLSTATPAAGFGTGTTDNSTAAACN